MNIQIYRFAIYGKQTVQIIKKSSYHFWSYFYLWLMTGVIV